MGGRVKVRAMENRTPPTLDQHLCFKLYSTSLKMTQLYKPLLAPLNLTYPQYLVMVVLWEEEGLGIKGVAERLQQDPGSITPLVKRLEAEGYVTRGRSPEDERNLVLTLTDKGRALRAEGLKVSEQIAHACAISVADVEGLAAGLAKLNGNLQTR
ncbi:MarR family winged helix-turn-helix transcriptional regulator [Pseudoduganella guangdongensis]|nr:MarR family transcriptional regulator [Pseudoduganella guangdongensis]